MIKGSMAKWFLWKTAIAATTTASPASTAFVSVSSRAASSTRQSLFLVCPQVALLSGGTGQRAHSTNRGTSLFESMRTGYYRNTNSDEIALGKLLEKAASVRSKITPQTAHEDLDEKKHDRLFFSSSYDASGSSKIGKTKMTDRGFSNWIVPGRIMVGQYPGRVPETNTPTEEEVKTHLRKIFFHTTAPEGDTNIKTKEVYFVSLQSELPPQDDHDSWNKNNGEIYLSDPSSRKEWPNPFSHYARTVEAVLQDRGSASVRFLHHPIQDLSVPSNSKNLKLLLWKILDFLDSSEAIESMVYVHCWGGRGRAGLTACCLLTLLEFAAASCGETEPKNSTNTSTNGIMDVQTIFDVVQTGYDSRLGSENMPQALSRSPQTESQREFVKKFYQDVREEAKIRAAHD